jgi:RNA polymerase sigma factor for flagellar operon FliA
MPRAASVAATRSRAATPPAPPCGKNELMGRYTALIRYVVERIAAGLPRNVDHEDLYSAGVLGLLDAYQKFDPRKGVKFETYAVWRIRGAVLDQLRSLDWASRSMRRRARELESTCQRMDQKLGRAATDDEVARAMHLDTGEYYRLIDQVRGAVLLSLDEVRVTDDQESTTLGDHLPDPQHVDLEACLEEEEGKAVLLRTLDRLPDQERLVVSLYYYEQMTLKEIGRTLGISESRVSQVHTRAMARLRGRVSRALREAA